jgi:undecaprenyl diphosphate synthase
VTQSALHVAIIMDGNGRWATRRGLPRTAGHRAGARTVRTIVEAAPAAGVRMLTLYAFSSDNWKRPAREVAALMRIFRAYLAAETAACVQSGVRLNVIGRRDRLPATLLTAIAAAEGATRGGARLDLRIALDYSAQDGILEAARRAAGAALSRDEFALLLDGAIHAGAPTTPVDLLIRTGGEQRLSDFLLWETAYAELYFSAVMWPDFGPADLQDAVGAFGARERRFGGLPASSQAAG